MILCDNFTGEICYILGGEFLTKIEYYMIFL
jgi:hypothetical protein